MRTLALLLAGFACTSTPALARSDTDYPHRDWGKVVMLDMSAEDATGCIAREMRRQGPVMTLPVEGGNDIDWTAGGLFQAGGTEAWMTFKVRPETDGSSLRIFYRHPIISKGVYGYMKKLQKHCLRVSKTDDLTR